MLPKTARMKKNSRLKMPINSIGLGSSITWFSNAFKDVILYPKVAIFYGGMFTYFYSKLSFFYKN